MSFQYTIINSCPPRNRKALFTNENVGKKMQEKEQLTSHIETAMRNSISNLIVLKNKATYIDGIYKNV